MIEKLHLTNNFFGSNNREDEVGLLRKKILTCLKKKILFSEYQTDFDKVWHEGMENHFLYLIIIHIIIYNYS